MSIILGLDTGGTYTDGVLINKRTKTILNKAKALTTKEKLSVGIRNCINLLNIINFESIELVCLSTTLATNAIVEGKGCKVGLICIGQVPDGPLPTEYIHYVKGKFDIYGNLTEDLSEDQVIESIRSFYGRVDSIAVSGYASVRNSSHEETVKKLIIEKLNIPVVCAHELTGTLGFYERTVTAVLNAKLVPIIKDLILECNTILNQFGIKAPFMIVKGDGSLMGPEMSLERPIETILSGPAASIYGGLFLTGLQNALIVDIGGTTTDIADVNDGLIKLNPQGANVGGWLTRVRASELYTYGTGGDSMIHIYPNGEIVFGPEKSIPFCLAADCHPSLLKKLIELDNIKSLSELDCYTIFKNNHLDKLNEEMFLVYSLIEKEPQTRYSLNIDHHNNLEEILEKLLSYDLIRRIAFTPTDLLHATGDYVRWNASASKIVANILSNYLSLLIKEFFKKSFYQMKLQITNACDNSIQHYLGVHDKKSLKIAREDFFKSHKPIVVIGAPALSWHIAFSDFSNTDVIVPENADVANAIGAAVGKVLHTLEALIRPNPITEELIAYTYKSRQTFEGLEAAKEYCVQTIKKDLKTLCQASGCTLYEFLEEAKDIFTTNYSEKTYVETRIKITVIGMVNSIRD